MQALIGKSPKIQQVAPPPPPPTVDDTRQAEEDLARLRRRRGLSSTFLFGRGKPGATAANSMLGSGPVGTAGGGTTGGTGGGGGRPGQRSTSQ